jgi:hypothetical protein
MHAEVLICKVDLVEKALMGGNSKEGRAPTYGSEFHLTPLIKLLVFSRSQAQRTRKRKSFAGVCRNNHVCLVIVCLLNFPLVQKEQQAILTQST